jgi:hypothetical protein
LAQPGALVQYGNPTFAAGSVSATVDQNTDLITFFDGTNDPLSGLPTMLLIVGKQLFDIVTTSEGYKFQVQLEVTCRNASNVIVGTQQLIPLATVEDLGAQAGTHDGLITNEMPLIVGGGANQNLDETFLAVAPDGFSDVAITKVEVRMHFLDLVGNISQAEMLSNVFLFDVIS